MEKCSRFCYCDKCHKKSKKVNNTALELLGIIFLLYGIGDFINSSGDSWFAYGHLFIIIIGIIMIDEGKTKIKK